MAKKYFLFLTILLLVQSVRSQSLSFKELISMQNADETNFKSLAKQKGFFFSHSRFDTFLERNTAVYYGSDSIGNKIQLERITDTLRYARNDTVVVTISFTFYDKPQYLLTIEDCKKMHYYFSYSEKFDGVDTTEYRLGSNIGQFFTGQKQGETFYKISTSFSPK